MAIEVPADLGGTLVPAMVLQPLVENALQHGVEPVDVATHIAISAKRRDGSLVLSVVDDGAGLPTAGLVEGVGLTNTRARLHHLYGHAATLTLRRRDGGGTVCEITLPIETAP